MSEVFDGVPAVASPFCIQSESFVYTLVCFLHFSFKGLFTYDTYTFDICITRFCSPFFFLKYPLDIAETNGNILPNSMKISDSQ